MRLSTTRRKIFALSISACLLCWGVVLAKGKPGGGGHGGGAGEEPAATVIPLSSAPGYVRDMTETANGTVQVIGLIYDGSGSYPLPVSWLVHESGAVLADMLAPLASGGETVPEAVNRFGMIVGGEYQPPDLISTRPLFWPSATAAPLELPLPDNTNAYATGINDDGLIVGKLRSSSPDAMESSLIAWQIGVIDGEPAVLDSQIFDLGDLQSAVLSPGEGYVAYTIHTSEGENRACRLELDWDGSQIVEVPGSRTQLFSVNSIADAVNNLGTVVGRSDTAGDPNDAAGGRGAYAMNLSGTLLNLPTLPGGRNKGIPYTWLNTNAVAINDVNAVLTWSHRTDLFQSQTDVLVIPGGSATNLKDLTPNWAKFSARNINNDGWIAGGVLDANGDEVPAVMILP